MADPVRDSQWLRHAFMLPLKQENAAFGSDTRRRYATSAAYKYTNTTLGGNFAINNPPQFTRFADIRQPGRGRTQKSREDGMGRYYSEAIDDPRQIVHMSFGVPRYNSMVNFFTSFYDRNTALMANTGRTSGAFYNLGAVSGYIVTLPLQPFIQGAALATRVYEFLTRQRPSKWYYFKPTMHTYWSAVNVIANELAIGQGLIPRVFSQGMETADDPGQSVTAEDLAQFHRLLPGVFREGGGVDVMALASRTQRMGDNAQRALRQLQASAGNIDEMRRAMTRHITATVGDPNPKANHPDYIKRYLAMEDGKADDSTSDHETFSTWGDLTANGIREFALAAHRDGSQFATFRVNHRGAVSESFSNSTRESDIAQQLNSKVAAGRSASFTMMQGNVTEVIGGVIDSAKSLAAGALDSVHLGGLAALMGTAFVDVPKMWDGSTANLPRADYTIPLPSPYGNKLSRFMNLYIPISMLLAGALPLSAGRAAYTSPFLCQIYHKGRVQCQLGMIDSLTITRGTGNVGWNAEDEMLGAEITFSVVDMSSILHVPIKGVFGASGDIASQAVQASSMLLGEAVAGDEGAAAGALLTNALGVWDEHSTFSDYMAVLSSMPVSESYYVGRRLNLNVTRAVEEFKRWRSPSNFMSWVMDGEPARTLSAFSQTTNRF